MYFKCNSNVAMGSKGASEAASTAAPVQSHYEDNLWWPSAKDDRDNSSKPVDRIKKKWNWSSKKF